MSFGAGRPSGFRAITQDAGWQNRDNGRLPALSAPKVTNPALLHGNQGQLSRQPASGSAVRRLHRHHRSADPLQGRWLRAGPVRLLPGLHRALRGLLRAGVLQCARHPHREHKAVAEQHRRSGKPLQPDLQDPGGAAGGPFREGPHRHPALHRALLGQAGDPEQPRVPDRGRREHRRRRPGAADERHRGERRDLDRGQGSAAGADHRQHDGHPRKARHEDRDRLLAQHRAPRVVAAHSRRRFADVLYQRQGRHQGERAVFGAGRVHRAPELQLLLQRPVLRRGDRQ